MDDNDKNKLEQIWAMYQSLMLYEAKKYFNNQAEAEDAVSEACIKLIRYLDKINEISSYQTRSYIVYIVRSVSIDILRKAKGNMNEPDDILETLPDDGVDILFDLIVKEGYQAIKDAIKSLPNQLKDVVYLSLVNERSHLEIAELLGITESASKMRLYRAKKEIRKKLAGGSIE